MAEKLALHGGSKVRETGFPSIGDTSGRMIGEEEKKLVLEVLDSGALNRNTGTKVKQFEEEFADWYGVDDAVASSSGTSALHIAVAALDLEPGDEVITTTITDMGSVIGILAQDLIPMFADVDKRTGCITAETIEQVMSPRTRAIMPIHLFGQPCDMDPIMKLARKHDLKVIEDASQAHGAVYRGRKVGQIGDINTFSFQQSKQMTTGDGGMTVSNDEKLADRARLFMDKAWPRTAGSRGHAFLGMNYRMPELSGAVGIGQLGKLDEILRRRRTTGERLTKAIAGIPGVNTPYHYDDIVHSYWIYSFTIDEDLLGVSAADFAKALSAEGVPFGKGYIPNPMFDYPAIQDRVTYGTSQIPWSLPQARPGITYSDDDVPNTMWFLEHTINMSWNEGLTESDADDLAAAVIKVATWFKENPGKVDG
jgi:perosamine synthetase